MKLIQIFKYEKYDISFLSAAEASGKLEVNYMPVPEFFLSIRHDISGSAW